MKASSIPSALCRIALRRHSLLLSAAAVATLLSLVTPAHADTVTRTVSYTYDPSTGLLLTETVEPGSTQCVQTEYQHDGYGNRKQVAVKPCASTTAETTFTPRVTINEFSARDASDGAVGTRLRLD